MTVKINIDTNPRFRPMVSLYVAATQISVIGVGAAVDSAAMQWAGFAVLVGLLLGVVNLVTRRDYGLTIQDARARLDQIEREEIGK